jgi:hypothetical protein
MKTQVKFVSVLLFCIFALLDCTPRYSQADMVTNNGQEITFFINDISKLTPEQLKMLQGLVKDQLASGEKLTEMGVNASVAIRKAEEDRKLASRVVWGAFFFVGVIIAGALTYLRKK